MRHIDDALGLAMVRRPAPGERWFDLGSGAGLPGLPLAAAFETTAFVLIEARRRRAEWLRGATQEVQLGNVTVREERIEHTGRSSLRGTADVVTARAVARLAVSAELGVPLLRLRGEMLVPRGRIGPAEWQEVRAATRLLRSGEPTRVPSPAGEPRGDSEVVIIRKLAATPLRFPRRVGIPNRDPLGAGRSS